MSRRLFEFSCNCQAFRDSVEIEVKGQKGKMRKLLLREIYPETPISQVAQAPEVPLKQTTMDQFLNKKVSREKPSNPSTSSSTFVLQIYCQNEKLFEFLVKTITQIHKNFIAQGKLTLVVKDTVNLQQCISLLINNSTEQMLTLFIDKIMQIRRGNIKEDKPIQEQENSQVQCVPKAQSQPLKLTELQLMQLKRRGVNLTKFEKKIGGVQEKKQHEFRCDPLPQVILIKIAQYLSVSQQYSMRLVCKHFDKYISLTITRLNFKRHTEIPMEVFFQCLSKFTCLDSFYLGRAKNLTAKCLQQYTIPYQRVLKVLDLGDYVYANDKMIENFILKCERVQYLILPYDSKIQSNTITIVNRRLGDLKKFWLKTRSPLNPNESISERSLAQLILSKKSQLELLKLPSVHVSIFEMLIQLEHFRFETLKFERIYVAKNQTEKLECIPQLFALCPDIKNLTIRNVHEKQASHSTLSLPIYLQVNKIFVHLKGLQSLSLGEFATNQTCDEIAKHCKQLVKIKISSPKVTDDGIQAILIAAEYLLKINIQNCFSVNGHCFESLKDNQGLIDLRKRIFKVSFDDYKMEMLSTVLNDKCIVHEIFSNKKK